MRNDFPRCADLKIDVHSSFRCSGTKVLKNSRPSVRFNGIDISRILQRANIFVAWDIACIFRTCWNFRLVGNLPESINALTGNPLTLQLIYSMTTVPKVSGLYSIAASILASMFFCLISSAISRCASVSNGSAFIILSRCAWRSSRAFICSLSTVENLSIMHERLDHRCETQNVVLLHTESLLTQIPGEERVR